MNNQNNQARKSSLTNKAQLLKLAGPSTQSVHINGVNQYTQTEMYLRILKLLPGLLLNRLRYGRALDILITHSPPFGIHDEDSQSHQGLKALNLLVRWANPRYHFHGHTHFYRQNLEKSTTQLYNTQVMNIYPYKIIEINDV